jgi:hypothetical protein
MANSSNQRLKLLYLMQILLERTDELHPMTITEVINALNAYGIMGREEYFVSGN